MGIWFSTFEIDFEHRGWPPQPPTLSRFRVSGEANFFLPDLTTKWDYFVLEN